MHMMLQFNAVGEKYIFCLSSGPGPFKRTKNGFWRNEQIVTYHFALYIVYLRMYT